MDSEDREVAETVLREATDSDRSPFVSDHPSLQTRTAEPFYPRSLHSINADFLHHVSSYKQCGGKDVFTVTLMEYLRVLKGCRDSNSSGVYESLYQMVCDAENPEKLKSIITAEMWEKVRVYVEALESTDSSGTPPVMFKESDLPTAKANYGLVQVLDDGSMRVNQVTLSDMNMQDVTQALGLALQNKEDVKEETRSTHKYDWQTFHLTKLPETEETNLSTLAKAAMSRVLEHGAKNRGSLKKPRSQVTPEDNMQYFEGEPRDIDVKFGRGGGTNNHKGNVMYLLEKLRLQPAYTLLATSRGKTCISMQLVSSVHSWGGRFVAKDEKIDRWFEVDLATARRKASQTLREDKTPAEQEQKRLFLTRKLEELERSSRKRRKIEDNEGETLLAGESLLKLNGDQPGVENNI